MHCKKGERIICGDATKVPSATGKAELTFGKEYTVAEDNNAAGLVYITNDLGEKLCYGTHRFVLAPPPNRIPKPVARMQCLHVARALEMEIQFIDAGVNYFLLRFVSEHFATVPNSRRENIIKEAFRLYGSKVAEQYEIIFETFTPNELKDKGIT